MVRKQGPASGEIVHVELYVVPRKHRAAFRASLRSPIRFARSITRAGGGTGPDYYLLDPRRARRGTPQLGAFLFVRPTEDLWVEIAFYPNWQKRRLILRRIWADPRFTVAAHDIERFVARRPRAWGVANGSLAKL
jgi:hypothetical protein